MTFNTLTAFKFC